MRNCALALTLLVAFISTVVSPADSDEADMLNQDMPAGVSGQVHKVVDGYSELCDAIRRQMIARLKAHKDFCPIPIVDPKAHIRRPDWQPVDVDSAKDLLAQAMPDLLSAGSPRREIRKAHPEYTLGQVADAFWSQYGEAILKVLRRNPSFFEKATLDVDNDGTAEDVYRVAAAQPADPKNPAGAWTIYSCNGGYPDGYPLYGFFFLPEKSKQMSTVARFGVGWDLFRYRARTFVTTIDNSFEVSAYWLKVLTSSGEAFSSQACFVRLDRK